MRPSSMLLTLYIVSSLFFTVTVTLVVLSKSRNYIYRCIGAVSACPFGSETFGVGEIQNFKPDKTGIASYSLYGNYEKYSPNLLLVVKKIPELLEGWVARVYVGYDTPQTIIDELKLDAEVIVMDGIYKGYEGSLWRFLPAAENLPFVSLDSDDDFDACLANKIKCWLNSNKNFASFYSPITLLPLSAGLWGARPFDNHAAIPDMKERIDKYCEHQFGFDELFLRQEIWPIAKYSCWRPFPIQLKEILYLAIIVFNFLIIYTIREITTLERIVWFEN